MEPNWKYIRRETIIDKDKLRDLIIKLEFQIALKEPKCHKAPGLVLKWLLYESVFTIFSFSKDNCEYK